jgi:hypothetical protein
MEDFSKTIFLTVLRRNYGEDWIIEYACRAREIPAETYLLKLQCMKNNVLPTI